MLPANLYFALGKPALASSAFHAAFYSDPAPFPFFSLLCEHDWVVVVQTPMGGPTQVLEYLARYSHRTAIGNACIRTTSAGQVTFKVGSDYTGGKRMTQLDGVEFVRRLLLHVLPTGVKRIHHYGLLVPGKAHASAQARDTLSMPMANLRALKSAKEITQRVARVARVDSARCPSRTAGRLRLVEVLKGNKTLPAPGMHDNIPPHRTGRP